MENLITEYLSYHDKYTKIYKKNKTVVFMQVGSFYEAYSIPDRGPNLHELSELTDVVCTKRDKTNKTLGLKNPYMYGFPLVSSQKYFSLLIERGFTLVIIDQVTPPPNPRRKVTNIYSPGTYLENVYRPESNFIISLYVEEISQKNAQQLSCIGMSAIDLTTGECYVHEAFTEFNDEKYDLDEAIRFINGLTPKEIIIYTNNLKKLTNECITNYLELEGKFFQFRSMNELINIRNYTKLEYQTKMLENVYVTENMVSVIEDLELDKTIFTRVALVGLLDYISNHNMNLTKNIQKPKFFIDGSHLILGNDAIHQLNIIDCNLNNNVINNSSGSNHIKFKSVLEVVNKATTSMGKRFIKMKLISPYINPDTLNKIYDKVEIMMENNYFRTIEEMLISISDIERYEHRMAIGLLHPSQLNDFINSYECINGLFSMIKENEKLVKYVKTADLRAGIKKFIFKCRSLFDFEKMKMYPLFDIKENIFNKGIFPKIDKMQEQLDNGHSIMEELKNTLNTMINDKTMGEKLQLKYNSRDGYYFQLTKKRAIILQSVLSTLNEIKLGNNVVKVQDLEFDTTTKIAKIKANLLKNKSDDLDELEGKIRIETYNEYVKTIGELYNEFRPIMRKSTVVITELDYVKTIAKVSLMYNYTRPIITVDKNSENSDKSFICAKGIRHPIVERILDHEYIPHDVDIGNDIKGMLIYGLNSAGKSVLMKAIGISVILAQAGFFVPAEKYFFYPYKSIYTRITATDNIFRGLSSFALEMVELNAILKRATKNTLVVGDEVCRGTEHISGNALVASTLLTLAKSGADFIFTTHLHELMQLDEIKKIDNIKSFHLSVEHDATTNSLIYDRILKPGTGERIYGITVAKNIIKNNDFINKALEIKNKLMDQHDSITDVKKSKYNNQLLVDKCSLCGKLNTAHSPTPLETHHINFQKDCENGFVKDKPHIAKNALFNLTVLCQDCHDKLHDNKTDILGYRMTTKGKKLIVKNNK